MKNEIVYLRWYDSYGCSSTWKNSDEYSEPDTVTIESVGWVIGENDLFISLAHNISYETAHTDEQCNGVMTIPKCSIIERRIIASSSCQVPVSNRSQQPT